MEGCKAGNKIVGFFIIAFLGSYITLSAQYKVSGELIDVENSYHDVIVLKSVDGTEEEVTINALGKFTTILDWNKIYFLSFNKPGFVSKVIEFSTVVPVDVHRKSIQPYELPIRLFKVFDGVDTVFFKNPVAKIRYDLDVNDFAADKDYSLNVKYRLEQMRKGEKKVQKEVLVGNVPKSTVSKDVVMIKSENNTKNKKVSKVEEVNGVIPVGRSDEVLEDAEIIETGIPALKTIYPLGRTDEYFELTGRVVKRTIINEGTIRRVYFSVKHDWGGEYFFIDEAEIGYRCISKKVYRAAIDRLVTASENK